MTMASKPNEPNKFLALKKSIAGLHKDISFLKKCLSLGLTPVSHKIKLREGIPIKLIHQWERDFLKDSVKKLYAKLNIKSLQCYALHLKLSKDFPFEFPSFLIKVQVAEHCEAERKRKLLSKKLRGLQAKYPNTSRPKPGVELIEGFVVNRSSENFSDVQMSFLNMGLNYAITGKPNMEQVIIDSESAIKTSNLSPSQKDMARSEVAEVLKCGFQGRIDLTEKEILNELRDKPVFYLKADKGNSVVILDKHDYDSKIQSKIDNGPYRCMRKNDPLPDMIKKVDTTLKQCGKILGFSPASLRVSNPTVPRIKGLPKIHKPGNEMREIVSGVNAPTEKIAKWLVQQFKNMPKQFRSRSVTNTLQFVEHLQSSGSIQDDEIMVSFDVSALFPSVSVKESTNLLENWLMQQDNSSSWRLKVLNYRKMVDLCMEQSYFKFREFFYRQTLGAPMGNPLSPFLCEIFMASLENKLDEMGLLPDRWWRYVDDVFCIVKRSQLQNLLDSINNLHKNIKFTHETEEGGKIAFLDVLIKRENGLFIFEIYRKPTNTMRVIPNTSNHSFQHKMAAFHHMIHRMNSIPLSPEGRANELSYIFETAKKNGYAPHSIQSIINKKEKELHKRSLTLLSSIKDTPQRRSVEFNKFNSYALRSKLNKFDIELVFSSRSNQVKSLLGSTKDPIEPLHKSGVYKISCSGCDKIYIGQTRRKLTDRFREHETKSKKSDSKVAQHVCETGHKITKDNLSLLRSVNGNPMKLDVAESIEINKLHPSVLLNKDKGEGYSWLFKFLPKKTISKFSTAKEKQVVRTSNQASITSFFVPTARSADGTTHDAVST